MTTKGLPARVPVSISLPVETLEDIGLCAEAMNWSRSKFIEVASKHFVEKVIGPGTPEEEEMTA